MAPKGGFFRLENAVWRFSNYGFEKGLSKWRELKCSTSSHDNWQFYYNYQTSSSTTLSILNSATVNLHVWGTTSFWAKVSVELDSDNRVWPEKKIIPYIIRQVWSNFVFGDRSFNFLNGFKWLSLALKYMADIGCASIIFFHHQFLLSLSKMFFKTDTTSHQYTWSVE